jgi:hypothetical protein
VTARRWKPIAVALVVFVAAGFIAANDVVAAAPPGKSDRARVESIPRIEARAKLMVLAATDLPVGWLVDTLWKPATFAQGGPGFSCRGHTVDVSSLVVQGTWSSQFYRRTPQGGWLATSAVYIFENAGQAQRYYDDAPRYLTRYCQFVGKRSNGLEISSLKLVPVPHVADQELDVRTRAVATNGGTASYEQDFVILRRGSTFESLVLEGQGTPIPADLKAALITKFAARAHT